MDGGVTGSIAGAPDAKARVAAILEDIRDAVITTRLDGVITEWSPGAENLYGYRADAVIGKHISLLYLESEFALGEKILQQAARGERSVIEGTRRGANGTSVEVEVRISPIFGDAGEVIGVSSIAHGLDRRRRRVQELQELNEFLERTQAVGHIGSWRTEIGPESVFTWTPETYKILGIEQGTAVRNIDFFNLVHRDDREMLMETLIRVRQDARRAEVELRITRLDGEQRWLLLTADVQTDDSGSVIALTGVVEDITDRKESEIRLSYEALHDQLTGLPNRYLFLDRLARALARARVGGSIVAVLYLDLDRFTHFNDAEGEERGDRLLRAVAERLTSSTGTTDTVARFGADEYAIIYEHLTSASQAAEHAARIIAIFAEPFPFDAGGDTEEQMENREHHITTSIGIALSVPGSTPEALVRDSDLAMHRAKEKGRNRFEIYDLALRQQVRSRFALEAQLRRALDQDELFLEYQPIASLGENRYVGAEALLRWRSPERGVVQPDEFVPLAEEIGLIVPIGRWVLEAACQQLREWRDVSPGSGDWHMSVNVAASQLHAPGFFDQINQATERSSLVAGALCIEITETAFVEGEIVSEVLSRIRGLGVRISIDDFGTKYSSLSYLKGLAIDELKIDRVFVEGLVTDKAHHAIVAAILAIGRSLDLAVTAEGVETEAQLTELRRLGCGSVQGLYFSKALPPEECFRVLQAPFSPFR